MMTRADVAERYEWRYKENPDGTVEHPEIKWSSTTPLLWLFYHLACSLPAGSSKTIVELGTYTGQASTVAWAAAVNDTGGHLWTIDQKDRGQVALYEADPKVCVIVDDDLEVGRRWQSDHEGEVRHCTVAFTEDNWADGELAILRFYRDYAIDLLYIDDGHEEEHVRAEVELWTPFVQPGGLVLFHDTAPNHGPHRVFLELVAQPEWEIAFMLPHTFSSGLDAARRLAPFGKAAPTPSIPGC